MLRHAQVCQHALKNKNKKAKPHVKKQQNQKAPSMEYKKGGPESQTDSFILRSPSAPFADKHYEAEDPRTLKPPFLVQNNNIIPTIRAVRTCLRYELAPVLYMYE